MAKINIKPRDTIESLIRDCLELHTDDETIEIPKWVLLQWLEKAKDAGMSLDQEQKAAARIRATLEEKDERIKSLSLELGRYMDAVDADGDGTTHAP